MKHSMEQHIKLFKEKYGDQELHVDNNGRLDVPQWLVEMLVHLSGVKSKKKRVLKKIVTKEINNLLERSLNENQ